MDRLWIFWYTAEVTECSSPTQERFSIQPKSFFRCYGEPVPIRQGTTAMKGKNGIKSIIFIIISSYYGILPALAADMSSQQDKQIGAIAAVTEGNSPAGSRQSMDRALEALQFSLQTLRSGISDYTATLVKRERINGKLGDEAHISVKIRHRRYQNQILTTPFSVYLYFQEPVSVKGREVIYVEGKNNNEMLAHEGGSLGRFLPNLWLRPNGFIAMQGERYPLTDIGIENLVLKLIEGIEAEREMQDIKSEITVLQDQKIGGRACTLLQISHPGAHPPADHCLTKIFFDDELKIPIGYATYGLPVSEDGQLPVLEEYSYLDVKLNVGLTDEDFDYKNKAYNF